MLVALTPVSWFVTRQYHTSMPRIKIISITCDKKGYNSMLGLRIMLNIYKSFRWAMLAYAWPDNSRTEVFSGYGKTYLYIFEHRPQMSDAPAWHTTNHAADEAYVFGAPFGSAVQIDGPWQEEDKEMSKTIMKYWTNFAKTGSVRSAFIHAVYMSIQGQICISRLSKNGTWRSPWSFLCANQSSSSTM